jgi:hypothetical protein
MNLFTIIGIVVVVLLVASYFGIHGMSGHTLSLHY